MAEPPDNETLQGWMAAEAVRLAKEGDTEAARDILRGFVEAVSLASERSWPSQLPLPLVRYLAEAFRQILDDDADASHALHLKAPKAGRPRGSTTHDPVKIAAAYWLLRRRGYAPEAANALVQSAAGADRTTVQNAANVCSAFEHPAQISDDVLLAIIAESPALAKLIK